MTVILPQATSGQIGMTGAVGDRAPPALYLLHGMSDDDTIWLRRTSIERYAAPLGPAVVMPKVHRSFYADEVDGNRYWTFLSEELPALVASFFRVSTRREDTFVAGLSMGGYGAVKWALRQPERFAAAASRSGMLDAAALCEHIPDPNLRRVFGPDGPRGTGGNLLALVGKADAAAIPALHVTCGTEDPLLPGNRRFLAAAEAVGVAVTSGISPGAHEWGFWDARIQEVPAWLPVAGR